MVGSAVVGAPANCKTPLTRSRGSTEESTRRGRSAHRRRPSNGCGNCAREPLFASAFAVTAVNPRLRVLDRARGQSP